MNTTPAPAITSERDEYGRSVLISADRTRCAFRIPATGEWLVNLDRHARGPRESRIMTVADRHEAIALLS